MNALPRLAFVCPMKWSEMAGDERSRFCNACGKSVVNLSALTEAERANLLAQARPGELCVAYRRGLEGKPVGLTSRLLPDPNLRQHAAAALAAGTILAAAVALTDSGNVRGENQTSNETILLGMLDPCEFPSALGEPGELETQPEGLIDRPHFALPPLAGMMPAPPRKVELKLPI